MGVSEAAVEVKGDFILTPNVPATAAPGDEFLVTVGVFNNTSGVNGPIRVAVKPSAGLSIVGSGAADLEIPEKGEGVGEFRIRANAVLGSASLDLHRKPRHCAGAERRERERPPSRCVSDPPDAWGCEWRERGRAPHPRHVHGTPHG